MYAPTLSDITDSVMARDKVSIGEKWWKPSHRNSRFEKCDQDDASTVFSIATFDSDLQEGSQLKVLYDDEEDIIVIKKVLADGWLWKKGSGNDIVCSRRWKHRWAELALIQKGEDTDVPALLLYWHPTYAVPTTYIALDGAQITQMDDENCGSFKSRFAILTRESICLEDVRIFSAESKERDEWIHIINVAMRDYEMKRTLPRSQKLLMHHTYDPFLNLIEAVQWCSTIKVKYMVTS